MSGFADTAAKFVEPINKLIDSVSGAIGKAYEPRHMRKIADAEAYRIQKIGEALRENSDIPIVYNQEGVSLSTADYEQFVKRAQHRMAFQELKKQENIESVADRAYGLLEAELPVTAEPVEEDWMLRFFNCVEDISSEKMQELWACLLAGEIKKPGSFSLRTLERLHTMTQREAEAFQNFCMHCVQFDDEFFIINSGEYQDNYEVPVSTILTLADCGLVVADANLVYRPKLKTGSNLLFYSAEYAFVVDSTTEEEHHIPIYPLTSSGVELAKLIQCSMPLSEFRDVVKACQRRFNGKLLHIYPFKQESDNTISYDATVDLLSDES